MYFFMLNAITTLVSFKNIYGKSDSSKKSKNLKSLNWTFDPSKVPFCNYCNRFQSFSLYNKILYLSILKFFENYVCRCNSRLIYLYRCLHISVYASVCDSRCSSVRSPSVYFDSYNNVTSKCLRDWTIKPPAEFSEDLRSSQDGSKM